MGDAGLLHYVLTVVLQFESQGKLRRGRPSGKQIQEEYRWQKMDFVKGAALLA